MWFQTIKCFNCESSFASVVCTVPSGVYCLIGPVEKASILKVDVQGQDHFYYNCWLLRTGMTVAGMWIDNGERSVPKSVECYPGG